MSIIQKVLGMDGLRELVIAFVVDPLDFRWWDFDPPSFFAYGTCAHILGERICREILKIRLHCRMASFLRLRLRRFKNHTAYVYPEYIRYRPHPLSHTAPDRYRWLKLTTPAHLKRKRKRRR